MHFEHRNLTWMLLFLAGDFCKTWKAEYQQKHICAVKGSSIVIQCLFYHPGNLLAESVMWGHIKPGHLKGRLVYSSSLRKATTRFQYIGDKHRNCSLKIHQVKHHDAGKYIIRFDNKISRWSGDVGSSIRVVDLKVLETKTNGNRTMKEGDSVNLTCINSCDGGDPSSAFIWFKNGEPISEGPVFYLRNISSTNSGNYTCSLKTHKETTSGIINTDAEYAPKNTVISVRPSTEVDSGSNITLICSSHANPPVEDYTWFKATVDDDIVAVGYQPVFFSSESGQYFCSVSNKHGSQNSSVVTLKIQFWATFTRHIIIITAVAAVAVLLTVANVAVRRLNKQRTRAPKTNCEEDTQNTDYVNWLTCDNSQSQEENQYEGGTTEPVYALVRLHNKRKSNMQAAAAAAAAVGLP
ncbi:B-cell receptor CD22-like isoform X2 [Toxotes jaculatrix]|uniref:B-cell receptor CD22-like isoform X2 n=1 Tax=Toxotes jaculatrix TaxID=941984 RepID=UPI001B3ACF24|nr:B-cell receptor CD22-like isoform X2 [Toxotes jaculatrix]